MNNTFAHQFRELLADRGGLIAAPGAYDGLTAKIIAAAGFDVVYMTGYGTAASYGLPDRGLLSFSEMIQNAARIVDACGLPVIADADTGYGDGGNVARTVREYERAGVAAIHIEDQAWPKRCGHMDGKHLVSTSEMVAKVRAAVDARRDDHLVIIARTDAIAVEGFEAALDRAEAYGKAGADMLFVEAPVETGQMIDVVRRLPDWPHVINIAPRTPAIPVGLLEAAGYAVALYPGVCFAAAMAK
ncbi:MAG: isocitrate lyase/PEP mutase family protein, partial [Candidatus Hydrogenedentota bacterium]